MLDPPSLLSFLAGGIVMLVGVVFPVVYVALKNRVPSGSSVANVHD